MDHFVFFTRWSYIKGKHIDNLGSLHSQQQKIVCFESVFTYLNQGKYL